MYEVLFCFCILLHWRVFLPLVESLCQIWFPMLTFAFFSLPLLRKTDVKIRKQTEKRETKRKQETVFYVFLRVSSANIGKFKLSLKALILSAFAFICFLVFSNAFRRTKIFTPSLSLWQYLLPSELLDVGLSLCRKTREQEGPLKGRNIAWCGCQADNLVLRKILLVSRDCLDTFQEAIWILLYLAVTIGCMD